MSSTLKSFADVARSKRHNGAKYFSKSHTSQLTRYFLNVIIQLNKEILEDILLKKEIFEDILLKFDVVKYSRSNDQLIPSLPELLTIFVAGQNFYLIGFWVDSIEKGHNCSTMIYFINYFLS